MGSAYTIGTRQPDIKRRDESTDCASMSHRCGNRRPCDTIYLSVRAIVRS